jgi:hypothetical protein
MRKLISGRLEDSAADGQSHEQGDSLNAQQLNPLRIRCPRASTGSTSTALARWRNSLVFLRKVP